MTSATDDNRLRAAACGLRPAESREPTAESLPRPLASLLLAFLVSACTTNAGSLSDAERRAVADSLEGMVRRAYDVSGPSAGAVERLLSLYPAGGRVVSASDGQMLTSRDSLADGIRYFWESMGRNMQQPRWIWEQMVTDVLDRNAAVITATYRVPHRTPRGEPHELAGAMTLVFARRDGRWVVVQEHLSDRPGLEPRMSGMPADTASPAR